MLITVLEEAGEEGGGVGVGVVLIVEAEAALRTAIVPFASRFYKT